MSHFAKSSASLKYFLAAKRFAIVIIALLQQSAEAVRHDAKGGQNWILPKEINADRFF
jgi:hypothetical protein